jgi:hypothetical protein
MEVDRIKVSIRFSKDTGKGAWHTIEVGAEATVEPNDDWGASQIELHEDLANHLRQLFGTPVKDQEEPEIAAPPKSREHWCEEHNIAFRHNQNDRGEWWSHKQGQGWCNERTV